MDSDKKEGLGPSPTPAPAPSLASSPYTAPPAQATSNQAIPTVTTHPDAYYRHTISDEEVDVFVNSSRDGLTDVMWGALGALLGSLPSTISYLILFTCDTCWPGKNPLTTQTHVTGVVQIIISAVSFAIFVVIFKINKNKCGTAFTLAAKIRARTNRIQS